jgi:hypothetical protein
MFRLTTVDPPAGQVRRITLVPFLADGRCVLVEGPGGPVLPAGEVLAGEDYLIDTVLRIPMQTAGFRYQRFGPFGLDGDHLYAWIEGAPYTGDRPHADVELTFCTAAQASERLTAAPVLAAAVRAAAAAYRAQDEQAFYAGTVRSLGRAYLLGQTPQQGSGFGGDGVAWRQARWHITEGIAAAGTFLDVGCANGLLMESVAAWCAERDVAVEPYGVDLSPALAELAAGRPDRSPPHPHCPAGHRAAAGQPKSRTWPPGDLALNSRFRCPRGWSADDIGAGPRAAGTVIASTAQQQARVVSNLPDIPKSQIDPSQGGVSC